VRAVDGISYNVEPGETLGIVGESGSGKSVSCYTLLGLIPQPPGRVESGTAMFGGVDLLRMREAEQRRIRGKRISMIFQDPMTALNPYMSIGAQLMEPLRIHENAPRREAYAKALEALDHVGIQDGPRRMKQYPHQFSGGMRQRVMIAMALITRPELLIADEPTTALDVTVQAQILTLIKRLQDEIGMAMILITHDLGVIAGTCDRVLVMYAGRIVEEAATRALFAKPRHPYTDALMASLPSRRVKGERLYTIPGAPPDLTTLFTGCPFAPRCAHAAQHCVDTIPKLEPVQNGHASACLRVQAGEL
jgi:oligopeptide transport system ATP-binding protein